MAKNSSQVRAQNKKTLVKRIRSRWQLYLLLLLPLAWLIIFAYVPMGGLVIAFKKYNVRQGIWESEWVGLKNFEKFFKSVKFPVVMRNTLTVSLYSLVVTFPIPIIFALLLNAMPGRRYKKVIQTVTYIPYFISTVVMVGLIFQVLDYRNGLWGSLFSLFTGKTAPNILANGKLFKHIYVWSAVWQTTGYSAIIYIAALAGVDQSLHEAAKVDGATKLQRIWHVDLPAIVPTMVILLIMSVGSVMSVGYEKVFLMQNNLNITASEVISTYVYKIGLQQQQYSYSAAIGLFNNGINFILLVVVNQVSKKLSGSSLW